MGYLLFSLGQQPADWEADTLGIKREAKHTHLCKPKHKVDMPRNSRVKHEGRTGVEGPEAYSLNSPSIERKAEAPASHALKDQCRPLLACVPVGDALRPAVEGLALQHVAVAEQGSGLAQACPVALLDG